MNSDSEDDEGDDYFFDQGPDPEKVSTGAAADVADDGDQRLEGLPRLLRYAILIHDHELLIEERLIAEIEEVCPGLSENAAWCTKPDIHHGIVLAAELDRLAVTEDRPALRSLADSVRLLSLPHADSAELFAEHRRVARSLALAFMAIADDLDDERRCDLEEIVSGWAALPTIGKLIVGRAGRAAQGAVWLGERTAQYRIRQARIEGRESARREFECTQETPDAAHEPTTSGTTNSRKASNNQIPTHHVIVGQLDEAQIRTGAIKEVVASVKNVLNKALPLVETPPLHDVRMPLMREFPYAAAVIDDALTDLIGRATIRLRPLLLVGDPGGGKSRFVRRLGEVLGLAVWRTDASQADGSAFSGTERRWHSAEPCHPLLAIARARTANPLVLLDEIEKAATRTDYGRLWDCLLGFLEPETAARYPDPALQIPLDLSHVSYIATANTLEPLPAPIRDRFRIVRFPKPTVADLEGLLPYLLAGLATERGLAPEWIEPLDHEEYRMVAATWQGGSVRRLRRILEAVLQSRDRLASRY